MVTEITKYFVTQSYFLYIIKPVDTLKLTPSNAFHNSSVDSHQGAAPPGANTLCKIISESLIGEESFKFIPFPLHVCIRWTIILVNDVLLVP